MIPLSPPSLLYKISLSTSSAEFSLGNFCNYDHQSEDAGANTEENDE